jgi:flavin-dependent dehydrogenase
MQLNDNSRVCIIGGGPSGSLAALHLLRQAKNAGLNLEVLLFEPRQFSKPGPGGCNRCAGILSTRLQRGLTEIGISLPEDVIQADIHEYAANLNGRPLHIKQPNPNHRIVSVYRGGGPRLAKGQPSASFDQYLIQEACRSGAQHIHSRVRKVIWEGKPVVVTARETYSADLVVLATGVNSKMPLASDFNYHAPKTEIMAQDEVLRPISWSSDQVHIYFKLPPGLIFGALIPKGRYLNISLLGHGLPTDAIPSFIEAQGLEGELTSSNGSLCGCTPRVGVSPARNYFGDRWVAVGDAAVTRLYKDGIGSAYSTSRVAMETAIKYGISHQAFKREYAPLCRSIARDNFYGRALFRMWKYALNNPRLLQIWQEAVIEEAGQPVDQRIHTRILWGMFTGDESYRDLFWLALSRDSLLGLLKSI